MCKITGAEWEGEKEREGKKSRTAAAAFRRDIHAELILLSNIMLGNFTFFDGGLASVGSMSRAGRGKKMPSRASFPLARMCSSETEVVEAL